MVSDNDRWEREEPEPPRDASEAELAWAVRDYGTTNLGWGSLCVVTMLVPLAMAVSSFAVGDVIYGALFMAAVVAQVVVLAAYCRNKYLLGPGGVTCRAPTRTQSHRWPEFATFRRQGSDVLLVFEGSRLQAPVRLHAPSNTEQVVSYVEAYLPAVNSEERRDE